MAHGNNPTHHHSGMLMPNSEASNPLDVPVTALELNKCCHTTANVHCGIIYGKINIELRYFLHFIFVLVTRKANTPPNRIEIMHVRTASAKVLPIGVQRFVFAKLLVNKSM